MLSIVAIVLMLAAVLSGSNPMAPPAVGFMYALQGVPPVLLGMGSTL